VIDELPGPPEPTVGLLPIMHSLEALFELAKALPSPLPPDDAVPLVERTRVLAILALQRLTDDQGKVLQRVLHPGFFDQDAKPDYPSFVARASIGVLCGFLRGCVAEAQVEAQRNANAEAYAKAKLKEERGVGFTRPTS
jgi:hypothetical protein